MSQSPVNAERNSQSLRWFQYRLWSLLLFMCLFSCACAVYFRWSAWEVVKVIKPEGDGIVARAFFSSDGSKLLVDVAEAPVGSAPSMDSTLIVYDGKNWQPVHKFPSTNMRIWPLNQHLSSDGTRLASFGFSQTQEDFLHYSLWDVTNGERLATLGKYERLVAFSPNSRLLASLGRASSAGQPVIIRDAATGALIQTFKLEHSRHAQLLFSPDSRFLLLLGDPLLLLDVETGETRPPIEGYDDNVSYASFSPTGDRVLTIDSDRTVVRVWETASGRQLFKIVDLPFDKGAADELLTSASFSPDGSMILTVEPKPEPPESPPEPPTPPSRVRVWDAVNGNEIGTYGETTDRMIHARFSPSGRRVLSRFSGRNHLYDLASGDLLFIFPANAVFAPNGDRLLTHSSEAVRIWRRQRPEWWWGHFYRAEVWAGLLFGLLWLRQVYRRLRPGANRHAGKSDGT